MPSTGSTSLRDKTAIVGVGNSAFDRYKPDISPLTLVVDAMRDALDDAGLRRDDIDGLLVNIGTPLGVDYDEVAEGLGLDIRFADQTWTHGRQLGTVLAHAAMAVECGLANYVACVCGLNWSRLGTVGAPGQFQDDREIGGAHFENPPYGMSSPGGAYALAAQRYFDLYGATSEDLAQVCVSIRNNARRNEKAFMQKELTVADHQNSRYVCEPLHLFDYCLTVGGACVVIVSSADRARDARKPPVNMLAFHGMHAGRKEATGGRPALGLHQQSPDDICPDPKDLGIYAEAGISRDDINGFYTYDAMSTIVWLALERWGHCKPGEAWEFTKDGAIELGGRLPINTHGGLLSEAHISSWNHICEITRQLRGECGDRQIENAEILQWATNRGDSVIFRRA